MPTSYPPSPFSIKLKEYLSLKNMTQVTLAKTAVLNLNYLGQLCTGRRVKPSLAIALSIAKALGLNSQETGDLLSTLTNIPISISDNSFDIRAMQIEYYTWLKYNFPTSDAIDQVLGVCEEAGELAHAALKMKQNIRGSEQEHRAELADAIGDTFIYLMGVCTLYHFNIEKIIQDTWNTVKQRDWQKSPQNGQVTM